MNDESHSVSDYLRWSVYGLLIAVSVGTMTARVMQVQSASRADPSPFLSANDRSRWATIRALVDDGTYAIDRIIFEQYDQHDDLTAPKEDEHDPVWHSIDIVYHRGSDGKWHYYSSKPTLLSTLLAGEYWLVKKLTGATLEEKPFYVVRLMLLFTNVLPLGLALTALAWLAEKYGTTDWGRMFVVACGCGATCMTTFAVALNNHLPAAVSVSFTLACLLPICWQRQEDWWRFAGAGLFSALAAACELPALAFFAVVAVILAQRSPRQAMVWFLPPALLIAAGAVGTNYLAHGTWKPPYAQRQDGKVLAKLPLDDKSPRIPSPQERTSEGGQLPRIALSSQWRQWLASGGVSVSPESWLEVTRPDKRWVLVDPQTRERYAVVNDEEMTELQIRQWGNWYEFPGSYWSSGQLQGVDRGEESIGLYALHCLIGHHGLFSLTPIWLLTLLGLGLALTGRDRDWRDLAIAVVVISLVVLAFYLTRPQIDRNYGGVSCCLRWMLWLAPLWLVAMLPAADWASPSRRACWFCLVCLAISAFSATYNSLNPFSHPWIFEYWQYLAWIKY
jgi:hypothetical protein